VADVRIVQVDERDNNWECNEPRFRVYLHGSGETSTSGWTDTYDITGADVLQVIDWAQKQAGDSLTYAVALVWDDKAQAELNPGGGRGLIWLVGYDGNANVFKDTREADALRRMLVRRAEPVLVPPADRMPAGVPNPYKGRAESR
jgi:hypothetical protein